MKNKILILKITIAFFLAGDIFLQIPIVKLSTEKAIEKIEKKCIISFLR